MTARAGRRPAPRTLLRSLRLGQLFRDDTATWKVTNLRRVDREVELVSDISDIGRRFVKVDVLARDYDQVEAGEALVGP